MFDLPVVHAIWHGVNVVKPDGKTNYGRAIGPEIG